MKKSLLKNTIGEIVLDYFKIIESGDLELAKKYLIEWTGGNIKLIWDGSSYTPAIIFTIKRYLTPSTIEYQKSKGYDIISITMQLLDEIKNG